MMNHSPRTGSFLCLVTVLFFPNVNAIGSAAIHTAQPTVGRAHRQPEPPMSNGGILYGPGYAFMLSAPAGWIFDSESGRDQGLAAVIYRPGESWTDGLAVMYANVDPKKNRSDTVANAIRRDIAQQRHLSARLKVTLLTPLVTADGRKATTYAFTRAGANSSQSEETTYIETPRAFVFLVLTSRTPAGLNGARTAFAQMVKSYRFIGDKVDIRVAPHRGR